jgi:adenylate kinase
MSYMRRGGLLKSNRTVFADLSSVLLPVLLASFAVPSYGQGGVPLIMLIGPPGSGKTTQAEILRKEFGMTVISADDLIRRNRQAFEKSKSPQLQGVELRVDPVLNRLVDEALASADRSKGVIFDGYPAAKIHGDYLPTLIKKYGLQKLVVIHLRVPDGVVTKRLKSQNRPDLEQELKDYHREMDFAKNYFPEADIRDVDGSKSVSDVAKAIRRNLR